MNELPLFIKDQETPAAIADFCLILSQNLKNNFSNELAEALLVSIVSGMLQRGVVHSFNSIGCSYEK